MPSPSGAAQESVPDRLRAALREAMKARDEPAVRALRTALAAIGNAEAVDVPVVSPSTGARGADPRFPGSVAGLGAGEAPRRELDEGTVLGLLSAEIAARLAAAEEYLRAGRPDLAIALHAEAQCLQAFLPA